MAVEILFAMRFLTPFEMTNPAKRLQRTAGLELPIKKSGREQAKQIASKKSIKFIRLVFKKLTQSTFHKFRENDWISKGNP